MTLTAQRFPHRLCRQNESAYAENDRLQETSERSGELRLDVASTHVEKEQEFTDRPLGTHL